MIVIVLNQVPAPGNRDCTEDIRISEVDTQAGNVIIVDPEIEGQAVIAGQTRDGHTGGGAIRQRHGLAESAAVHVIGRSVLGVECPVEAGAVGIVAVKVLEPTTVPENSATSSAPPLPCGGSLTGYVWSMTCP